MTIVLDVSHDENCGMHASGERPYKVIFGQLREEQKNLMGQESVPLGVTRIHNDQIIGQVVKDSLAQKTSDQGRTTEELCQHLAASIQEGGNKHAKRCACLDCTTRWQQIPIADHMGPPQGTDPLLFGKHVSLTYDQVYTTP